MHRLLLYLGTGLLCGWSLLAVPATAAPIFSAWTVIDLGAMTVQAGDGVTVNWGEPTPQPTSTRGANGWWLTDQEFGAYSEIHREDLVEFPYQGATYNGYAYSGATLRIPFTVTGSGSLVVTAPYRAGYESPYPYPDAYGGGPDFVIAGLTLVQGEAFAPDYSNRRFDWFQLDKPDFYEGVLRTVYPDPAPLFFADGETGFLSLYAWSECSIWYNEIPGPSGEGGGSPAPVPEPATLLLLGGGIVALAGRRRLAG